MSEGVNECLDEYEGVKICLNVGKSVDMSKGVKE